uniref:Claudin-34 n=1 Tax=Sciurus vulgaris TaxID=55149 RepID=A0A8D2E153_SCIVU
ISHAHNALICLQLKHTYAAAMVWLVSSANRQVAGFAIATIGCILSGISMGLVEWRMWYINQPLLSPSGVACVGMWRVCIYHHHYSNISNAKVCYRYTYHDDFLPPDIRVSQHLLLAANILGLLGKAFIILALRNVYMGILQKDDTCNPFVASGILNIAASGCISIVVLWNYYSIMSMEGIEFPSSFRVPFKPDVQEVGSALIVATLAAFLLLLSGTIFLSYTFPLDIQMHPEV